MGACVRKSRISQADGLLAPYSGWLIRACAHSCSVFASQIASAQGRGALSSLETTRPGLLRKMVNSATTSHQSRNISWVGRSPSARKQEKPVRFLPSQVFQSCQRRCNGIAGFVTSAGIGIRLLNTFLISSKISQETSQKGSELRTCGQMPQYMNCGRRPSIQSVWRVPVRKGITGPIEQQAYLRTPDPLKKLQSIRACHS